MDAALAIFTRQLATLLGSGLNLGDSLYMCARQAPSPRLAEVIFGLRRDVETGHSFPRALARQPAVFSRVYVAMARAGEAGGTLDQSLSLLARLLDGEVSWRRQVRTALLYPALVLAVGAGVVLFLLLWVLPNFVQMFEGMNLQLPLPTRLMVGATKGARDPGSVLVAAMAGAAALALLARLPREWLPVLGALHRVAAISRFCRTFGTLLAGGVPLLPAFDLAGSATGNPALVAALRRARVQVEAGGDLAACLEMLPRMVRQMVAVGMESGTLDAMLLRLADLYETERQHRVAALLVLVEPVMMGALGFVVFFLVVATYLPLRCCCGTLG